MDKSLHQRLLDEGLRFLDVVPADRIYDGGGIRYLGAADYGGANIVAVVAADLAPEIELADWIKDKDPRVLYAEAA
jgi:hypothetical protein